MQAHVLPIVIQQARQSRDAQSARTVAALTAVQQAESTLRQLEDFRIDYLRRSPAASGETLQIERLLDFQRFVTRLDEAIAIQQNEAALRRHRQFESQQQLAEAQRRLLAFETLATRQAAEREHSARRREQRDTDEFAARAQHRPPGHGAT